MSQGTTVTMFSKANDTNASNIAAKESWGHKKRENLFTNSVVGTSSGGISYVTSKTRSTNDIQGKIVNTNVASDIAIDGNGMFVVSSSPNGESVYTRDGSLRQDELGFWKNGSGMLLRAWRLDGQGNLPQNSSLLSSLEAVNFANTKGAPVATDVISIAMNLRAGQDALRGAGIEAKLSSTGLNKATKSTDLLLPEKGLKLGDTLTFTSTTSGTPETVTYGGIVVANTASAQPILGATGPSNQFTFGSNTGMLSSGSYKLNIKVGTDTYTFTAVQGVDDPKNGTFSTILGLSNAINNVSALQSRVDVEGRLYVGPSKNASNGANSDVIFTESGNNTNTSLKSALGLVDLPEVTGVKYFNSFDTLKGVISDNASITSLKATIEDRNISITSLLSSAGFNITGESKGINAINTAILNPTGNEVGRASLYIEAPSHGLGVGDFIRTNQNLHANVPAGSYMVGSVDSNGFTINLTEDNSLFPAAAAPASINPIGATWQKSMGEKFNAQTGSIASSVVGVSGLVTINSSHNLVDNDVVYIEGGNYKDASGVNAINMPAGYYIVSSVVANASFQVKAAEVTNVTPGTDAASLNFRKVGTTAGAFGDTTSTFDTKIFEAEGAIVDRYIKTYIPNNTYQVGDTIAFSDLPSPLDIDGIALENNVQYKITNRTNDTVEFKVFDLSGAHVPGTGTGAPAAAGATNLSAINPNTVSINSFSRLFDFFGINKEQTVYEETYNADDVSKNLTSNKFPSSKTFNRSITAYDSLGSPYTMLLYFAKLDTNKWAVELSAQEDENGDFDIKNLKTTNGLIQSGTINFDSDGNVILPVEGFEGAVQVERTNGSALNNITIDWANELSDITSGTVTQTENDNNVDIVQANGQSAGTLVKLSVSSDGYIVGTFDSGEFRNLYQIPLASFANVNGLVSSSNGTFEVSRESGSMLLKSAGIGGTGKIIGGALEASNVDSTSELIKVQELSNTIRENARIASINLNISKTILSELNN